MSKKKYYCSKECKTIAWANHKAVCKLKCESQTSSLSNKSILVHCRNGYLPGVQYYVDSGMNVNTPFGADRWTPLITACIHDHVECAEYLLQNGADPNLADTSEQGNTPLMAASVNGCENCISLLRRWE